MMVPVTSMLQLHCRHLRHSFILILLTLVSLNLWAGSCWKDKGAQIVEDSKCLCLKNKSCKKFKLPKFDLSSMPKEMQEKFNKNLLIYQRLTNAVYNNQEDVIDKEMDKIPEMQKELAQMNVDLLNAYNKKRVKNGEKPMDFKGEQEKIRKNMELFSKQTLENDSATKASIQNTNNLLMPSNVVANPRDPWVIINNLKKRLGQKEKKKMETPEIQEIGTIEAKKEVSGEFEADDYVHRKDAGSIFKIISNKYLNIFFQ